MYLRIRQLKFSTFFKLHRFVSIEKEAKKPDQLQFAII